MRKALRSHVGIAVFLCCLLAALMGSRLIEADSTIQENPRAGEAILEATREYELMGRADDLLRWAPWLCRDPGPARMRLSESQAPTDHGRKLYSLFVRNPGAYVQGLDHEAPIGQVIVKESWEPQEMLEGETLPPTVTAVRKNVTYGHRGIPEGVRELEERFQPWAEAGGKRYRRGRKGSLFVMVKVGNQFEGSDNGWIYGTTDPSGKILHHAGRITTCMHCHAKAGPDRLFGLPRGR